MRLRLLLLGSLTLLLPAEAATKRPRYEIVGYVFGRNETLDSRAIAAHKMTRINYAFFALKDGVIVERGDHDAENLAVLTSLRKINPQLQVLVSVGGGGTGSSGFSDMASTARGRSRFVDAAVALVRKYDLDGLDVDWEYPGYTNVKTTTVRPEDRVNYTLLLKELRLRFNGEQRQIGRPLVTSSATGATQVWLDHTDMRSASKWLSTVNLMCYDWYGNAGPTSGHDSPLYTVTEDPKRISIDDAVTKNIAAGVPGRKIVVGVPFYGRSWVVVDSVNNGLWRPVTGDGKEVNFGDIEPLIEQQGFVRFWDKAAASPYLYNSATHTFVTYNDAEAEKARAAYVRKHHLAGLMFWQYTGDPRNTLLDAIDAGLSSKPDGTN